MLLNIIAVNVSPQRALLSILDTVVENTGIYECSGISSLGYISSTSVILSVESN